MPSLVGSEMCIRDSIKDMEGKGSEELIGKVQVALDTLKETLKGEDMEKIKADTEALTKPLYELSAELYKQTEAAKGADGTETALSLIHI